MQVETDQGEIIERVAALDVGKAEVVCCARVPGPGERRRQEVRTVSTMTAALLALAVGCPTVVGFGVVDHVVPFASVQATVERLRAPLEVMTFPVSHDAGPAMRAWDRFDER